MALRTTAPEVKDLLGDDYGLRADGTPPSLTIHMRSANALLARVITCAARKGITITDEELYLLETWLSAHYYTQNDPTYTSKSTAGASGSFQGQTGKFFEASRYGQTAIKLDPSGCIENIQGSQTARMGWVGLPPSEQTDYRDRD